MGPLLLDQGRCHGGFRGDAEVELEVLHADGLALTGWLPIRYLCPLDVPGQTQYDTYADDDVIQHRIDNDGPYVTRGYLLDDMGRTCPNTWNVCPNSYPDIAAPRRRARRLDSMGNVLQDERDLHEPEPKYYC